MNTDDQRLAADDVLQQARWDDLHRLVRGELAELPTPLADLDLAPADGETHQGLSDVLANRPFRLLWLAEILTQTAQNALWYTALVLVDRATQSTTFLSLTVVSAVLPAALFGMLAGIMVDRWPKKLTLLACNLGRAVVVPLYLLHAESVLAVLVANFIINAVAQFFYPAQLASIPHFLEKKQLTAAMGLFHLTWTLAQFLGLILLGPVTLKLFGEGTGAAVVIFGSVGSYAVAGALVALLPHDTADDEARAALRNSRAGSVFQRLWHDLREGVVCIHQNVPARLAILYLALTTTVLLVIATLAPRFAARELGMDAEDAILLIAPAGLAMAAASFTAHRLARRFRRELLVQRGLLLMVAGLVLLAVAGMVERWTIARGILPGDAVDHWRLIFSRLGVVMAVAALIGWQVGMIMVPAQAIVAEWAPAHLRGRIFAIQLTIANLASIFPLLLLGGLADLAGIPAVILLIALGVFCVWFLTLRRAEVLRQRHLPV